MRNNLYIDFHQINLYIKEVVQMECAVRNVGNFNRLLEAICFSIKGKQEAVNRQYSLPALSGILIKFDSWARSCTHRYSECIRGSDLRSYHPVEMIKRISRIIF